MYDEKVPRFPGKFRGGQTIPRSSFRRHWNTQLLLLVVGITTLILAFFHPSLYHVFEWSAPDRSRIKCSDISDANIPSLGLALSLSHATAAIAQGNDGPGSVREGRGDVRTDTIGSVPVNEEFINVMKRLEEDSSRHVRPPYYGEFFGPGPTERLRQLARSIKRNLGLPATSDVKILAEPLRPLVEKLKERLQCTPDRGILVTPGIKALYDEDIEDIMRYLGLQQLPLRHYPSFQTGCEQPHDLFTAYAANRFGLCRTYWNNTACTEEESKMPMIDAAVGISQSNRGIVISTATQIRVAYHTHDYGVGALVGFDRYAKINYDENNLDKYWQLIEDAVDENVYYFQPSRTSMVLIYDGDDDVDTDRLETMVQKILDRKQLSQTTIYGKDSFFAVAIGAAKFAHRARYVDTVTVADADLSSTSHHRLHFKSDLRHQGVPNPLDCPWRSDKLR